ncbi:MAG: type II toxin-antitoxin system RelE/ParE family toxin [Sulfuricellaceae bacterium]|nr:type II toxin-antitoxin system RelE/ParE family toxin [Sulfuricellaceae bacterium]
MAQVVYSERVFADLERLVDFLAESDKKAALETLSTIQEAVSILERHPLIGRSCEQGLRELVISRGHTGYIALYDFIETDDAVLVLAIRHQREAGYIE